MKKKDAENQDKETLGSNGQEALVQKRDQLIFGLGKFVYSLCQLEALQFLFVSEYQEAEKDIRELLKNIDELDMQIGKHSAGKSGATRELLADPAANAIFERGVAASVDEPAEPVTKFAAEENTFVEDDQTEMNADIAQIQVPEAKLKEVPAVERLTPKQSAGDRASDSYRALGNRLVFKNQTERKLFDQMLSLLLSKDETDREKGFKKMACSFGKECMYQVAQLAIQDPSLTVRRAVLKVLAREKTKEVAEVYKIALHDSDADIRVSAIKSISMLLFAESFSILKPLLHDHDPLVRSNALLYVGLYCHEPGITAAATLRNDPNVDVRKSLAKMLEIVKPPQAVIILNEMLAGSAEPEVQKAVGAALSKVTKKK